MNKNIIGGVGYMNHNSNVSGGCNNVNNMQYANGYNNCNYNININNNNNFNIINNFRNNNNINNINNINNFINSNNNYMTNNNNNFNNYNNNNNFNNYNNINTDNDWTIIFSKKPENDFFDSYPFINVAVQTKPNETIKNLIIEYRSKAVDNKKKRFIFNDKELFPEGKTLLDIGLKNNSIIKVLYDGLSPEVKKINIQFIKSSQQLYNINRFSNLSGFLKLYILKEIASKLDNSHLNDLFNKSNYIWYIMNILKNGYNKNNHPNVYKNNEFEFMIENLNNFSDYLNTKINSNIILNILNYQYLKKEDLMKVCDSYYRLDKYNGFMKFLEFELEKSKKESIFEFSINSFIIIERPDYKTFLNEREKCPNRNDKILFYGANIIPNSNNIQNILNKKVFTDSFDYSWYKYNNSGTISPDPYRIPRLNESFNLITYYIYYNKVVGNNNNHLGKNEIKITQQNAYFGNEYNIENMNQICPLISFNLKRNEFCIIWRDTNFKNSDYLQQFLEGMKSKKGKYNLFPCKETPEAISLVKRKKYNKIILISNFQEGGLNFIIEARKYIGNEVVALISAGNPEHLHKVKDCKNTLFSNEPKFIEDYLKCFNYNILENERKVMIQDLKKKMEKHYNNVGFNFKFNFDENFLDFPNYKKDGQYNELSF